VTDRGNDLALVEAALFLSPQPLTRRGLAKLLGDVRLAYVDQLLEDLAAAFNDSARGIELLVDEGRAILRVKRDYVDRVAHLAPQQDIPRPILRTLAVIAYNHPMTQANLVRVRGNKAYGHVHELIERGLIRAEAQGRTLLLHVTAEFLRHFGLNSVEEFRFHAPPQAEIASIDEEAASREEEAGHEDPASPDEPTPPEEEASSPGEEVSSAGQDASATEDASTIEGASVTENAPAASEDASTTDDVLQSDHPGGT
jgi:segregation and condensation protein B